MASPYQVDVTFHAISRFRERAHPHVFNPRTRKIQLLDTLDEEEIRDIMRAERARAVELRGPERIYVDQRSAARHGRPSTDQTMWMFDEHVYFQKDESIVTFLIAPDGLMRALNHLPISLRLTVEPSLAARLLGVSLDVRTIDELEDAMRRVIRRGMATGPSKVGAQTFVGPWEVLLLDHGLERQETWTVFCTVQSNSESNVVVAADVHDRAFAPPTAPKQPSPRNSLERMTIGVQVGGQEISLSLSTILIPLARRLSSPQADDVMKWFLAHASEALPLSPSGMQFFFPHVSIPQGAIAIAFAFDVSGLPLRDTSARTLLVYGSRGKRPGGAATAVITSTLTLVECKNKGYLTEM